MEVIVLILGVVYAMAGIWAADRTIYANKVLFGSGTEIFMRRLITGVFLGVLLIPVAIIKSIFRR